MTDSVLMATGLREPDRSDAKRAVNDAYLALCLEHNLTQTSKTVTLTAGQGDYSIVDDLGIDNLVSFSTLVGTPIDGSSSSELEPTYPSRLLDLRARFSDSHAPWTYATIGTDTLSVYPATGGTLTVWYTYAPDDLEGDGDIPSAIPAAFHSVIEDGAIMTAGRWSRSEAVREVVIARAERNYQTGVARIRRWLNNRLGAATPEVGTIRTRRPRYVPSNRSTDTGG